jgi:hypothetical protein
MVTMAVLVGVAALTFPLARHLMADTRVTAASDMVRARWADTRVRALEEGRAYVFEVMQNSGKFKVRPADSSASGHVYEGELPQNILFQCAGGGASDSYTPVVTFQADGSADTGTDDDPMVTFGDPEGGRQVALRLRRSTGAVTSEESSGNRP